MRTVLAVLLAVGLAACSGDSGSWGPLAVMTTDSGMQARNEGTLVLTERCSFLERDGAREVLAWPSPQTTWLPESSTVSFTRSTGEIVELRTGQHVVLGGGGSSFAEDGLSGEQWAAGMTWVASPDPSCLVDTRWSVSDVMPG
jgi:hypothetical protein